MNNRIFMATLVVAVLVAGGIIYQKRSQINVFGVRQDSVMESVAAGLRGEAKAEGITFKNPDGDPSTAAPAEDQPQPQAAPEQPMPAQAPQLANPQAPPQAMEQPPAPPPTPPILYFGESCPHCIKVNDFIKQNNIAARIGLIELEVSKDNNNAQQAIAAARTCGVEESKMGVPFLFSDGKCLFGDEDVISYLKAKTGM